MGTRQRMVLPALDGLRAVAAAAVLLTHVAYRTGETTQGAGGAVLARLDAGVAVFFVLSGFLLYRPHATARAAGTPAPSLRRYALRRPAGRAADPDLVAVHGAGLLRRAAGAGRAGPAVGGAGAGRLRGAGVRLDRSGAPAGPAGPDAAVAARAPGLVRRRDGGGGAGRPGPAAAASGPAGPAGAPRRSSRTP